MLTSGVDIISPRIPKKWLNIISPIRIVIGCRFIDLLIIIGWMNVDSINCRISTINRVIIRYLLLIDSATRRAGIAPIYGPI